MTPPAVAVAISYILAVVCLVLIIDPRTQTQQPSVLFGNAAGTPTPIAVTRGGMVQATLASGTATPATIRPTSPALVLISAPGVTTIDAGQVRQVVTKITVTAAAMTPASTQHVLQLASASNRTFIQHVFADLTQTFACASVCTTSTLSMQVGNAATSDNYLRAFDADAAIGVFGDAAAELGSALTEATIPTAIGSPGAAVWLTMRSATGMLGNGSVTHLSQGSVTIYITSIVMP